MKKITQYLLLKKDKMVCAGKGRFYKQERVKGFGKLGQERLAKANVAIIGVGGLGCICADTLVRMGIGGIMLFDEDEVELSNLHRQTLYTEDDIGQKKVDVAKTKLHNRNPDTKVQTFPKLTKENLSVLDSADIILDCTDSMPTRHLIDTYATKNKTKVVYAMAAGTKGYVYTYNPEDKTKPLYQVFSQKTGEDCDTLGVLPTQLHIVTSVQINECLKLILGEQASKELIHIDGWNNNITSIKVK